MESRSSFYIFIHFSASNLVLILTKKVDDSCFRLENWFLEWIISCRKGYDGMKVETRILDSGSLRMYLLLLFRKLQTCDSRFRYIILYSYVLPNNVNFIFTYRGIVQCLVSEFSDATLENSIVYEVSGIPNSCVKY